MTRARWRAGVIAAGRGERLRGGNGRLKPLVQVAGRTLIERVLSSVGEVAPADVVVIVNDESTAVKEFVDATRWPFTLGWIVETTPSSMHSFLRVVETLAAGGDAGPFLVSTVDTVAMPGAFAEFAAAAERLDADLVLAVTMPRDDERPLLVRVNAAGRVTELGASVCTTDPGTSSGDRVLATAGYYVVSASILREAEAARADGLTSLRLFLERLVTNGHKVAAVPVEAGIDVDRPCDVSAAESFLQHGGRSLLAGSSWVNDQQPATRESKP